jgi:hypothetical protein
MSGLLTGFLMRLRRLNPMGILLYHILTEISRLRAGLFLRRGP